MLGPSGCLAWIYRLTINEKFVIIPTMKNEKNSAELIIDRFGGQSSLASILGRRQSTVQHWAKTGRIPSQWHQSLLKLAREKGIALEPKDFVTGENLDIAPPDGRLGVLLVGLGAVSSTSTPSSVATIRASNALFRVSSPVRIML